MFDLIGKNAFARKRRAWGRPTDCVPAIECLENRLVLASQLATAFENGSLTISGSGDADDVIVTVTGVNSVSLTSSGAINGAGAGPFLVTGSLFISMGNNGDIVTIEGAAAGTLSSGNIHVDMGSGDDALLIARTSDLTIVGDLTLLGGNGDDFINIGPAAVGTAFVCQSLAIDNGADAGITQIAYIDGTTVNGNLSITNSGTGLQDVQLGFIVANTVTGNLVVTQSNPANTLNYSVDIRDTSVTGNVTVTNGNGAGDALIRFQSTAATTVSGTTTLTNGNNANNRIIFAGAAGALGLTHTGKITAKNGNATTDNQIVIDGLLASGASSASFTNGDADSNLIDIGETVAVVFTGTVSATNGNATVSTNSIDVNLTDFARTATFINGVAATSNLVNVGDDSAADDVDVLGNLVIKNGVATADDNTVTLDNLQVGGNVTISNAAAGSGAGDTTTVDLGSVVGEAVTITGDLSITNLAAGATRTVELDNTTVNGRTGVAINNVGAGNSTMNLGVTVLVTILGKLDVQDGTATGTLNAEALTVGSITYNDLGGGTDTIGLGETGATTTVNGVTRLNTGNGSDTVRIGSAGAVFNGLVSVSLGSGNDTIDIGALASSPAFGSANNYQFDGGAGLDSFFADPLSLSDYDPLNLPTLPRKLRAKITNFETLGV